MAHDPIYPTFSDAEYARRYSEVRARMNNAGVSTLVFFGRGATPEIHYLCNWQTTTEAWLVFPHEGDSTLFVQLSNHLPNAKRMAIIDDVRFGGSGPTGGVDSVPTVIEHLKERGLERAHIGIVGGIPYQQYFRLQEALPGVEWSDFSGQMRDQRHVKSLEEIERMRIAASLSDRSVMALVENMRPGMTEHQLARIIDDAFMDDGGLSTVRFLISTSMRNAHGGVPQQHLSPRVLQTGDVVACELSASYWGYTGQVLRSFTIGEEPTPEYRDLHDVAREAFEAVAAVIKEGTTIDEVLDAADVVTQRGYTIYDDFLHGAGQLPPILRTRDTSRGYPENFRFKENMCLVIQPNVVTHDGMKGVQFGEMFRVTKTGLEQMHDCPRQFFVVAN